MENPRKFKIFYNKHEHKYFNYQIKKNKKLYHAILFF